MASSFRLSWRRTWRGRSWRRGGGRLTMISSVPWRIETSPPSASRTHTISGPRRKRRRPRRRRTSPARRRRPHLASDWRRGVAAAQPDCRHARRQTPRSPAADRGVSIETWHLPLFPCRRLLVVAQRSGGDVVTPSLPKASWIPGTSTKWGVAKRAAACCCNESGAVHAPHLLSAEVARVIGRYELSCWHRPEPVHGGRSSTPQISTSTTTTVPRWMCWGRRDALSSTDAATA